MDTDLPETCKIKEIFADFKNEVNLFWNYIQIWASISSLFYVILACGDQQINSGLFLVGTAIILIYYTFCWLLVNSAIELVAKVCCEKIEECCAC